MLSNISNKKDKTDSPKIVIASTNEKKKKELQNILLSLFPQDVGIEVLSLKSFENPPEIIEDSPTFAGNASKKAIETAKFTQILSIADDSGLVVEALNGEPGVKSARYASCISGKGEYTNSPDEENVKMLLDRMKNIPLDQRKAKFVCFIAIADRNGIIGEKDGELCGEITYKPQGTNGFGYDPVLFIPELGKTAAQLEPELKNTISHRSKALRKALQILANYWSIPL